jgi:hypothetical protein
MLPKEECGALMNELIPIEIKNGENLWCAYCRYTTKFFILLLHYYETVHTSYPI